jgi:hypothetical protein
MAGDRVQRKTLVVGSLVFWSLITICTALSTNYLQIG